MTRFREVPPQSKYERVIEGCNASRYFSLPESAFRGTDVKPGPLPGSLRGIEAFAGIEQAKVRHGVKNEFSSGDSGHM